MASRVLIERLRAEHLAELATHLRQPEVYEHIGGLPLLEDFILDREIALRGPGPAASREHWLNFLVRERSTRRMLGRLEATLHDSIAEVAFLFSPELWGEGCAREALALLRGEVRARCGITDFWATTNPANTRCQALLVRAGYRQGVMGGPRLRNFRAGGRGVRLRGVP